MQTCPHMLERTIDHRATGPALYVEGVQRSEPEYQAGDAMVLVCPRGCPDIEITIGLEEPDRTKQEEML
ncbi:MAG: hypothetical protein Q7R68_11130 [Nitrospirales bacterium]|nr:hypothetical protein [Nitrospirales bacterium]